MLGAKEGEIAGGGEGSSDRSGRYVSWADKDAAAREAVAGGGAARGGGGSELVTWRGLKRTAVAGAATAAVVAVGGRARGERGSRGEEDVTRV